MNFVFKTLTIFLGFSLVSCNVQSNEKFNSSNKENVEYIEQSSSNEVNFNESNSNIIDESNDVFSSESNQEIKYLHFDEKIKIYINPSVQYSNLYASNLGNEGYYMNCISIILVELLSKYTNLIVYSNNDLPGKSLSSSVKESNLLNADYHIALHSNAGGGTGSEIFYTRSSYGLSSSILTSLQEVLPYKTRGLKNGESSMYELKATKAKACLIEVLFHDDEKQALFIINNQKEIARAIFFGITSYLS